MRRKALAAGLLSVLFTVGVVARAQTSAYETVVFSAVDAYQHGLGAYLDVGGVVRGEGAPSTIRSLLSYASAENQAGCERMALLAMNRPGYYLLSLNLNIYRAADGTVAARYLTSCGLSRAVP